jgi:predicted DNA-binding protein (UPF0251 family)
MVNEALRLKGVIESNGKSQAPETTVKPEVVNTELQSAKDKLAQMENADSRIK